MTKISVVRSAPLGRVLVLGTALALLFAMIRSVPSTAGPPAGQVSDVTARAVDAVVGGQTISSKATCLVCAGIIIGLAGTSVVGVVSLLSGVPEFGIACGLACYDGYA